MRNNVLSDFGYKSIRILHRNCPGTKTEQTIIIQIVKIGYNVLALFPSFLSTFILVGLVPSLGSVGHS
jgi:hypothetical protein